MSHKQTLLSWKRFFVNEEHLTLPNGITTKHVTLSHPGAVVILPITNDGNLIMLKQYRPSIKQWIYEFPAGTLESGEEIEQCAKRELAEETQLEAKEWHALGESLPAPGFCDEVQYLFVAIKLSRCSAAMDEDEDEVIEVVDFPVVEVKDMIKKNIIKDSKTIVTFFRAQLHGWIT